MLAIHQETEDEKYVKMTQAPVRKLVCTLAIPTIISMLVTSVYNMADTFFVGQIGTSATAAVGLAFPLMAIIQAVGFTLGMGSGNYIARLLGQKRRDEAEKVAATGFYTSLAVGLLLAVLGLIFLKPLVQMLGATDTSLAFTEDYVRFILLGTPYMAASFVLNNLLRFQGSAFYAMLGIGVGGILNIALDPLFIFVFDMGVSGAALATILSQLTSFFLLLHNTGRNGNIGVHPRSFSPKWPVYKEILRGGLPSFYRQGLSSVAAVFLNLAARGYGDAAIAALSVVSRVFNFALSALLGFGQGFQPVCAFNYGAGKQNRVLKAFWFCIKISVIGLTLMAVIGFAFAPQIIEIFRRGDPDVIRIGSLALRLQAVTFPFSAWVVLSNMLLQTIGRGTKASILALARQGLFFLPAIFLLPQIWGLLGIQATQPVADLFTLLLSVPLTISVLRELRAAADKESSL